jgi:hypothetical protein
VLGHGWRAPVFRLLNIGNITQKFFFGTFVTLSGCRLTAVTRWLPRAPLKQAIGRPFFFGERN